MLTNGLILVANDERTHPYQRGRGLIMGLRLWLRKIIETERLVGVAVARLVSILHLFQVDALNEHGCLKPIGRV